MNISQIPILEGYRKLLPNKIAEVAIFSFGASFICSSLLQNDLNRALFSAGLSATISLVTSLTLPLWRIFFAQNNGRLSDSASTFRPVFNFVASTLLYNTLSDFKVRVIASLFFTGALGLTQSKHYAETSQTVDPAEGFVFV